MSYKQYFIQKITALAEHLLANKSHWHSVFEKAQRENQWFTAENCEMSLQAIIDNYMNPEKLETWLKKYEIPPKPTQKNIGLVLAGNLPLVGFHDILCVLACGHTPQIKYATKDTVLTKYLVHQLQLLDNEHLFSIIEAPILKKFDAIIATGSTNTGRYFEYYFRKVPHIIRKNRVSVAVLTGKETEAEIALLGTDIFSYFGLGCRNVSKIFVPTHFDFTFFLDNLQDFDVVMLHHKYKNNYDYNRSLLLLNQTEHYAADHIMVTCNAQVSAPTSVLHYQFYENEDELTDLILDQYSDIQCIVSNPKRYDGNCIAFGQAQYPQLWDYADNTDTMQFLLNI